MDSILTLEWAWGLWRPGGKRDLRGEYVSGLGSEGGSSDEQEDIAR